MSGQAGTRRRRFEPTVLGRGGRPPLGSRETGRLLRALATRLNVTQDSVAVVFGDDETLRDLNRRFRHRNRPTDVLSFPAGETGGGPGGGPMGDIVISTQAVRRRARAGRRAVSRETGVLVIHGFLHLLGYDHEADDGQMDLLEKTLRAEMLGAGAAE